MRLVTLACSNTEIVCALGCADQLVGVDNHSDFPPEVVSRLPRVGPDLTIDIEAVARLEPDLVLASLTVPGHEKVVEGLDRAGLPYIAPEPKTLEDVYRDILWIADLLGARARGDELVAQMKKDLEVSPPTSGRRPRIAVQWWPKPVILPGRDSWVQQLLERAGGINPLGHEPVKSRPLTDEEVRDLAPDAIVISWCGVPTEKYRTDVVYRNPLWQDVPAVRKGRITPIPEAFLGRPAPRLVEGFRALRQVVQQAGGADRE